jgi:NADPH:quinone reductase-like Zn-dependent oxidoreductase
MFDSKSVMGLMVPRLWDDHGTFEPLLRPLLELIEDGTIQPLVDRTFTLREAADAHTYIAERRNIGKVVLVPA